MLPKPTVKVETYWGDRDGGRAQLTLHLPFSTPLSDAVSAASFIVDKVRGISDAVCLGYKLIWEYRDVSGLSAAPDSDVLRAAWLFYRNDATIYEAIRVPSVKRSLLAGAGRFAGVALVEPGTPGFLSKEQLEAFVSGTTTPEGAPFPGQYVNGGLML